MTAMLHRTWRLITGFGQFWYGFIIGDDWAAAAGVLVMLGAAYGLRVLHVPAWWAGPVVITAALLTTLRRAGRGEAARPAGAGRGQRPSGQHTESSDEKERIHGHR